MTEPKQSRVPILLRIVGLGIVFCVLSWVPVVYVGVMCQKSLDHATAEKLAESLHEMHPMLEFQGGAGIERNLHITVKGAVDKNARKEIMDWLKEQREKEHPAIRLTLDFPEGGRLYLDS